MSTFAEFFWLVATDPDANKHFARFAQDVVREHGDKLSPEHREALASGDPEAITSAMLAESGGKEMPFRITWGYTVPIVPEPGETGE